MVSIKIGAVSKQTGVSIDTLRYYEKIGLLKPKREANKREYSTGDLERLEYILTLKKATFSLAEILFLFKFEDSLQSIEEVYNINRKDLKELIDMVVRKKQDLYLKIEELESAKEMIIKIEKKLKTLED